MASEPPPTDAEQPKSLLAQYDKRLLWRLTAWGGAAAISLAVAAIVSQTETGDKRLQFALFDLDQPDQITVTEAAATKPTADLTEVKRATDLTAAKLAAVERNTAATRAETRRLALQVSKLTADSFHVTGRLANIEHQIDGITGSIKAHAEKAAADAIAKAMPPRSAYDKAFDVTAPVISSPATMFPKLSLIMPPAPGSEPSPLTAYASKEEPVRERDVETTSAIKTPPKAEAKDQSKKDQFEKDQSKIESKIEAQAEPMAKAASHAEELKAKAGPKAVPEAKQQIPLEPLPPSKPMVKTEHKAAPSTAAAKMARASVPRRRSSPYVLPTHGYGIDLGGADSVTVVKAQWAAVKANFGPLLVGLRPTAVRDHRLLSEGAYRLVIGRVHSLKAAERLCSRFASQKVSCQPIEFDDGQVIWR
jgi:hypothetical protein